MSKIREKGVLFFFEDVFLSVLKIILPYNIYNFLYAYDDWMRVYSVRKLLRKIDPQKDKKIIDIGGGWGNLERGLIRDDIVIYEPNEDYMEKAKKYVRVVIAGKGEYLNVKDKEFDISMSVHTFEHIDKSNRLRFVEEMTRIASQYVILIFPFEKWADKLCNDIIKYCRRIDVKPSTFTIEHIQMGIPASSDLKKNLELIDYFEFSSFTQQNYYMDKMLFYLFYIKVPLLKIFLFPLISIIAFLLRNVNPHTTVVVVGERLNK